MKSFVKAMDKNGRDFPYLKKKFHKISNANNKEGIKINPIFCYIEELMKDRNSKVGWISQKKCIGFFHKRSEVLLRQQKFDK